MATTKKIKPQRPQTLYIQDVNDCEEFKTLSNGKVIEYPFMIRIVDGGEDIVSEEPTSGKVFSSDWSREFYLNKKGRTSFTFNSVLLAVCTIMENLEPKEFEACFDASGEFDANKLVGFSFKGLIVTLDNGQRFIDWASTFKLNGIKVPNLGAEDEDEVQVVEESEEIDPNDLPY